VYNGAQNYAECYYFFVASYLYQSQICRYDERADNVLVTKYKIGFI